MFDLHTHTVFSDGADSAEEMVRTAVDKGLTMLGFSDHSHVDWDECGMSLKNTEAYRKEIARLKPLWAEKITLLCGLERDYYSDDRLDYDYVIGSVHWLKMTDGHAVSVDWTAEKLIRDVNRYFGGDFYALAEAYYALAADVVRQTGCDIIGHFDLITKFNEGNRLFDEEHPRYRAAWQRAADELLRTGAIFEINTGAISRGYRTQPYPSATIRAYLKAHGGRMILSSDAHRKENIASGFEQLREEGSASFAGCRTSPEKPMAGGTENALFI